MRAFNAFYYSWAPTLANFVASHDWARSLARMAIRPLIYVLRVAKMVSTPIFGSHPEAAAFLAGLIASFFVGLIYFSPIASTILLLSRTKVRRIFVLPWAISIILAVLGEALGSPNVLLISTSSFVLSTVALASFLPAKLIECLKERGHA